MGSPGLRAPRPGRYSPGIQPPILGEDPGMKEPVHDFDEIIDPTAAPQHHVATAGEDDLPEASAGQLLPEDGEPVQDAPAEAEATE